VIGLSVCLEFQSLFPKPRRSGARMRKRYVSQRGTNRCSNILDYMGHPCKNTRVVSEQGPERLVILFIRCVIPVEEAGGIHGAGEEGHCGRFSLSKHSCLGSYTSWPLRFVLRCFISRENLLAACSPGRRLLRIGKLRVDVRLTDSASQHELVRLMRNNMNNAIARCMLPAYRESQDQVSRI